MDSAITAHFGGDTTDLKESTQEASIMMKGFSTGASRAVREIGEGFVGAVVFVEAVKGIKDLSAAAIDAAEQERTTSEITGQAVSEQAQAWLDLKDVVSGVGSGLKQFGIDTISIFPDIGESIGDMINTLRGISPEAQGQYEKMQNSATVTLATIQAALDKYLAELPAATAAANAKLVALNEQYVSETLSTQDKLSANLANQAAIQAQMLAMDPSSLAYLKDEVALQQLVNDSVKLQADTQRSAATEQAQLNSMALTADQNFVRLRDDALKASMQDMTIGEQIVALTFQKSKYEADAAASVDSEKNAHVYLNAAAQLGLEIAQKKAEVSKATALSEEDQLAMYIKQTPALYQINTLSNDQLKSLQLQSQEKQNQYQIDQLLALGAGNLTDAQKATLTQLILNTAELKKQLDLINGQVAAENNVATAVVNVTTKVKTLEDATQEDVDNASGVKGGIPGTTSYQTGSGVGGVNQQYQDSQSDANAKANLESLQKNLEAEINSYQNSDTAEEEALIPALQAKINQLHQQEINISPGNPNGTPPAPYAAPDISKNVQTQTDALTDIQNTLKTLLR